MLRYVVALDLFLLNFCITLIFNNLVFGYFSRKIEYYFFKNIALEFVVEFRKIIILQLQDSFLLYLILLVRNHLGHFFKCQSETLNFHPLDLNQFANGFLHRTSWFFNLKNLGLDTLHTPFTLFQFLVPPLSDFGSNPLVKSLTGC